MRRNDLHSDRELARELRRLDAPAPSSAQMSALARRIMIRANPMLEARRRGAARWWEYAAAWAGTLLPLGAAATLVAGVSLALSAATNAPARPQGPDRAALLQAVTNRAPSGHLRDVGLDPRAAEPEHMHAMRRAR